MRLAISVEILYLRILALRVMSSKLYLKVCILLVYSGLGNLFTLSSSDPDVSMNVSQLIQSKGYPVQEYKVTTEDGYILEIQRIPWGRNGAPVDQTSTTTPVLVQHGILASSADFVNNFYNQSLGFLLADAGYDVWLGNSRGNTYTSHVNLSRKGREFWNFSSSLVLINLQITLRPSLLFKYKDMKMSNADEIMTYDLPAMIDTVLKISGQEKLQYIGWSQGAQILFQLLSERPEFNNKITLFSGLAPVAYLGHMRAPLRVLLPFEDVLALLVEILYHGELFSSGDLIKWLAQTMCSHPASRLACEAFVGFINNVDSSEQNKTRLPVYLSNFPAGSSIRNLDHLSQLVRCDCFQKYDFGSFGNKEKYGKVNPPQYKLSNTKLPVAIYWSDGDELVTTKDVARLRSELPNVFAFYKVPDVKFTHLDFAWGITSANVLYREMIDLMDKYK